MCGIAGYQGRFAPDLIAKMRTAINHRGPDDSGTYFSHDKSVALAHTRLSIIDLSQLGHQPMLSDDEQIVLVFNGEIYNYRELRKDLELRGVIFRGHSDTEVVLRLYQIDGEAMLTKLNGIFALAIWDTRDQKLRIARDGLGVKPLYYAFTEQGFIFASEIKAVLQCESVSRNLDAAAIFQTVGFLWTPGPATCLAAVKKLEAGHILRIDAHGQISQDIFYRLPIGQEESEMTFSDAVELTRKQLLAAVDRQLVADVPVGSFLSGGLDSSAIVALASQKRGSIHCFTIESETGTEDGTVDDLPYARRVADQFNCPLNVIKIQHNMYRDLEKMIWYLDEPQADLAALNVFYISQEARRQGIKVLLSGAGGDDLFTGYRRHVAVNYSRMMDVIPGFLRNLGPGLSAILPKSGLSRRLGKVLNELPLTENQRIVSYFIWHNQARLAGLFRPEFIEQIGFSQMYDPMVNELQSLDAARKGNHALHPLEKCLRLEQKYFLTDHNLNYTDKLSMAVGVEVRVPFLDLELVNAAASIPMRYKQKGKEGKYVLKKAMEGILPDDVIWRPKSGFGAPVRQWIRGDLTTLVDDILSPANLRKRAIFDEYKVQQFIKDDREGRIDGSYIVLALMSFELWCRQYMDSVSPRLTHYW